MGNCYSLFFHFPVVVFRCAFNYGCGYSYCITFFFLFLEKQSLEIYKQAFSKVCVGRGLRFCIAIVIFS